MKSSLVLTFWLVFALTLPSCNAIEDLDAIEVNEDNIGEGEGEGEECGQLAPCGGSIEGQWEVLHTCPDILPHLPEVENPFASCDGADFGVWRQLVGMANVGPDYYSLEIGLETNLDVELPRPCVTEGCEVLMENLNEEGAEWGCNGLDDGGCFCHLYHWEGNPEHGSWSMGREGVLLMDPDERPEREAIYCIEDEWMLKLQNAHPDAPGYVVFSRLP